MWWVFLEIFVFIALIIVAFIGGYMFGYSDKVDEMKERYYSQRNDEL